MPPPPVSASSWAVYNMKTKALIFGKMEKERREIASLTKIMTCYTVISLAERFNLDLDNILVTVSYEASNILGTVADLVEGDTFTIHDMLYALMLPSGNDAAIALAEYFGQLLLDD